MADNIQLSDQIGSAGAILATDQIGTDHYQIVKLTYGALDSQTIASSGAGAVDAGVPRVTLASDDPGVALLGTIDADTSTIAGDTTSLDGKIVVGAGTEAGAVRVTLATDSTGLLSVDDNGGSLTVDGTVTANLSATDNAVLDTIATNTTDGATETTLAALNAKLVTGTVIGDVNLGATDNAVLDTIATNTTDGATQTTLAALNAKFVSGTDIGDVDVTSSALPTGAATSANQLPATSGGISTVYRDEDIDETAVALKAGAGQIYWIHCINLDATPVYLHFYDVAQGSVTVGTTGELCSFAVPSQGDALGAGFTMHFNHGVQFGTAITVACTTTISGTAGPGTNEVILNVGYA